MEQNKSDKNLTARERLSLIRITRTEAEKKEIQKRTSEAIDGLKKNLQRLHAARLIDEVPHDRWSAEVREAAEIAGVNIDDLTLGELVEQCELIAKRERWKAKLLAEELKHNGNVPENDEPNYKEKIALRNKVAKELYRTEKLQTAVHKWVKLADVVNADSRVIPLGLKTLTRSNARNIIETPKSHRKK